MSEALIVMFLALAVYLGSKKLKFAIIPCLFALVVSCGKPKEPEVIRIEPKMIDSLHGVYDQIYAE